MKRQYDHQEIEKKWRKHWEESKQDEVELKKTENKYYCLDMFPYPSGSGLHVGHWRGYVMSDFYARYQQLQGKTVLHPMGFDAFGLPAENAAIKYKSHPKKFTDEAIANFMPQLQAIGASFDWSKQVTTSDPNYYRWTQWLFLQLFKHGLAEKRLSQVNWCPNDQTVLANEQVVNGCCERCGAKVTKKELSQWYFKTSEFAQELIDGLNEVKWPDHVRALQRNWIGKSEGAELIFNSDAGQIPVFTTRPDTLFGVTALVLSPEHPMLEKVVTEEQKSAVENYLESVRAKTNIDRQQQKESEKTAAFTGSYATVPLSNEKVPIWTADYVLMDYGTGAVMSVPAHDERDFMFAKTHNLPIKQVIAPNLIQSVEPAKYRPSEPIIKGESVIVFIKHPTEDKYLGLDWKESAWGAKTLLTGTIDDLSPEETVSKEIKEETGFHNFKVVEKLGVIDGLFYHLPKKTNKLVRGHVFLVQLENEQRENIEDHEAARHEMKWLSPKELENFLTPMSHQLALGWLPNGYQPYTEYGAMVNSGEYDWQTSEEATKAIIEELEKKNLGKKTTTYRLRDWLVSRQRYWGAPIPIVYDPEGKAHPVKDEHLPLLLPEDVDFLPGGESPLARSQEYKERAEKLYGKGWNFDTDTLDTFVDSSWYFLRYLSPTDSSQAFDKDIVEKWMPVDLYIGGIEHATLHLLYARFITRFLAKFGYIDAKITEPFTQLFNIGMVTLHGAKMSKSKGNVISPDPLIEHYGTDALRGYELFLGPMDIEVEWNPRGINGIHRFLIKLSSLTERVENEQNTELQAEFATYMQAINSMISDFRLNTYISEAMKFANVLEKQRTISTSIFSQFLVTLFPVFPFLSAELYSELNAGKEISTAQWPVVAEVTKTTVTVNVLINQKFVVAITVDANADEKTVEKAAIENAEVALRVAGRQISRFIYKPGSVANLIVTG